MHRKQIIWVGIVGDPEILADPANQTTFAKLLAGEYKAADLEVLHSKDRRDPRVHSARNNEKWRLVLTTIMLNGLPHFYILKDMRNHQHENLHCLEPGGVQEELNSVPAQKHIRAYLTKKRAEEEEASQANKEAVDSGQKKAPYSLDYTIEYMSMEFFDNQWFQFNEKQLEIYNQIPPILCRGSPGSGKSLLAIAFMAKAITQQKIPIYIAPSIDLINAMKDMWMGTPASQTVGGNAAIFITGDELLQSHYPKKRIVVNLIV